MSETSYRMDKPFYLLRREKLKGSILSAAEIHAPAAHLRGRAGPQPTPICPDGSLPWSGDCGPGGWSAKMFLHQMLSILDSRWKPSDTERLLSVSTAETLQVRVDGGSSLSAALLPSAPDSPELYLKLRSLSALIKRAARQKRPL